MVVVVIVVVGAVGSQAREQSKKQTRGGMCYLLIKQSSQGAKCWSQGPTLWCPHTGASSLVSRTGTSVCPHGGVVVGLTDPHSDEEGEKEREHEDGRGGLNTSRRSGRAPLLTNWSAKVCREGVRIFVRNWPCSGGSLKSLGPLLTIGRRKIFKAPPRRRSNLCLQGARRFRLPPERREVLKTPSQPPALSFFSSSLLHRSVRPTATTTPRVGTPACWSLRPALCSL